MIKAKSTHKFEIHEEELVIAVLLARVLVEKISAGYAQDSGPMQALKKKLKIQVLSPENLVIPDVKYKIYKDDLRYCEVR